MDLEVSFLNSLIFLIFCIARHIQSYISKIFSLIFVKPALIWAKVINADKKLPLERRRSNDKAFVVIDLLVWHHRWLWNYLNFAFKTNSSISGVRHQYNLYEHLLTWNLGIPITGYEEDKTTFTIELLKGPPNEQGGRSCDFTWLTSHNVAGNFKIISKELSEDNEVVLNAVWLSGKERGKSFKITKNFPFGSRLSLGSKAKPSSIYYPPKWIVILMELIVSGSAILAFVEFTKGGWKLLSPIKDSIVLLATSIEAKASEVFHLFF